MSLYCSSYKQLQTCTVKKAAQRISDYFEDFENVVVTRAFNYRSVLRMSVNEVLGGWLLRELVALNTKTVVKKRFKCIILSIILQRLKVAVLISCNLN